MRGVAYNNSDDAGLPWKRLAGIATDRAPSMTGGGEWNGGTYSKKPRRGGCL